MSSSRKEASTTVRFRREEDPKRQKCSTEHSILFLTHDGKRRRKTSISDQAGNH